jgi:hypothetical protein
MKELKLALDPEIAARVAMALRKYATDTQDKLLDAVAAAIESKLSSRRGRYR